ncbi:MAG: 1-(5-phosphoribosyl)-5-[Bacteroidaceae bacterium]|nr:1-(5-phosphoribosyl)-5-[(5-phosphoribosylamino)methylideneamino]imidazole-4-carboxamide isomerase [Bacteroidaceae bacterium]
MLPIPAIDIIDGQCVRLTQGDYNQRTVYAADPAEIARRFEDEGFPRLHLVDLDGARAGHVVNHAVLEKIASTTQLIIDFGGGVKSDEDLHIVFDSGAQMVTLGSIAVKAPERVIAWGEQYGKEHIIIGADALHGTIRVSGWEQESGIALKDFVASYYNLGFRHVLCTDIGRDGMLSGPAIELYRTLLADFPELQLIASGGVKDFDDLCQLHEAGLPAAVFGKAIYEGRINLSDVARRFLP